MLYILHTNFLCYLKTLLYVKDLRKENLQLVKELAKQEKKKAKPRSTFPIIQLSTFFYFIGTICIDFSYTFNFLIFLVSVAVAIISVFTSFLVGST